MLAAAQGGYSLGMTADAPQASPAEMAQQWLAASPFINLLGMKVTTYEKDLARITLPFKEELVTIADVVHGGAISSLVDTAAAAAAWSGAEGVTTLRGTTVGMHVSFLAAARSAELVAEARVVRRGKSICFCEVDVTDAEGEVVAKGMVTYKLG
jgi:uncharacterized protein (TIGR00369 family)